jgi:hypothetical protein
MEGSMNKYKNRGNNEIYKLGWTHGLYDAVADDGALQRRAKV